MDRSRQDPLARSPLLHMEMILFVARAEKRRPELAKRLRARRKLIADIVEATLKDSAKGDDAEPALDGLGRAGAGGRLPPAPADRSGDNAGRQFSARDHGFAAQDGIVVGVKTTLQWHSQFAETSFSPITPATMKTMQSNRAGDAESPSTAIPRMAVPAAPMPVQTA